MEIERAKVLGFCCGVRRTIKMIETALSADQPLATLGAIVHNTTVVNELAARGARPVSDLAEVTERVVAITAHGAPRQIFSQIKARGLQIINTTCPIVHKAQQRAAELTAAGFTVVICGEENHPEVKGILSWTDGTGIASLSADLKLPPVERGIALIAQTTIKEEFFADFACQLASRYNKTYKIKIINTTCPEASYRYSEAEELAKRTDAIIVIGNRNSANTCNLTKIAGGKGIAYHIEQASEIDPSWLKGVKRMGITAGTSTPDGLINEVIKTLQRLVNLQSAVY
ncbi:4-hydroxy-3-methylbut-2-enyl diphosphate reductase [Candidatus Acetothermia bacterium]|nr:4-hydroxy-3-methylbut-2-enyl diphosphate reductase [Candidatus Acetothermia bacterium]